MYFVQDPSNQKLNQDLNWKDEKKWRVKTVVDSNENKNTL